MHDERYILPIDSTDIRQYSVKNMSPVPKAVAAVKRALDARGWTYNELARQVDTDSGVISRIMTAKRRPGLDLAFRIEKVLGVAASMWLESEETAA